MICGVSLAAQENVGLGEPFVLVRPYCLAWHGILSYRIESRGRALDWQQDDEHHKLHHVFSLVLVCHMVARREGSVVVVVVAFFDCG